MTKAYATEITSRAAEALGFPTEGRFAEWLWRTCSSDHGIPVERAADLYRACGYIPFSGYPLARSGKITRMTREQVEAELQTNPLIAEFGTA